VSERAPLEWVIEENKVSGNSVVADGNKLETAISASRPEGVNYVWERVINHSGEKMTTIAKKMKDKDNAI
jgi:hypothetical protein